MSSQTTDVRYADELLAVRCQLGDRDAFELLVVRWHEPLWRYLRRLTDSDDMAADLSQDTWVKVLRGIAKLRNPASIQPWLFGIARRVAMDRMRTKYSRSLEADIDIDDVAAAESDPIQDIEFASLEVKLDLLPMRERETLVLFYLQELSIDEMGALLGVPQGTVKSRLNRARRLLRNEMKGAVG